MSLRLIVTRHAKSSWDSPATGDHDRPLNERGQNAATALGKWLAQRGEMPDLLLSSDARRTRETWDRISAELPGEASERWLRTLYLAPAQTMLDVLRAEGGSAAVVMVLGHNPGIAAFAGMLAATPPAHPRFPVYPTGATTILDFAISGWNKADWGAGTVVDFVVPREL